MKSIYGVNLLKPKLPYIIFKNLVRTAKKTPHFTIANINWLTLVKEITAVYCENEARTINTVCRFSDLKTGGTGLCRVGVRYV